MDAYSVVTEFIYRERKAIMMNDGRANLADYVLVMDRGTYMELMCCEESKMYMRICHEETKVEIHGYQIIVDEEEETDAPVLELIHKEVFHAEIERIKKEAADALYRRFQSEALGDVRATHPVGSVLADYSPDWQASSVAKY